MAKAAKETLYDALKADLFREHVFDSYGAHFAFIVREDGAHSNSIDLAVLDPLVKRAQQLSEAEKEYMLGKQFKTENELTQFHNQVADKWANYAREFCELILLESLRSRSPPRVVVEVQYSPFSLEARAKLLRKGEHEIEEFLSQPNINASQALALNRLNTLRPIYAFIHHDEKPGTSGANLHQERQKGRDPHQAAFYSNASVIASMLGSKDNTAAHVADEYYTRANVLLHHEEGLLEQEEAKKRLSAFLWKMPRE